MIFSITFYSFAEVEAGSLEAVLNVWQNFTNSYEEKNLSAADFEKLIYELKLFRNSDGYIIETDGSKSKLALSVDMTIIHAENALTAKQRNDINSFTAETSELFMSMNEFLIHMVRTEVAFVRPFVVLLAGISFLCIFLVFGALAYSKKRREAQILLEKNRQEALVTKTIARVQENERNRISRDLHDTVIQDSRTVLLYARELEKNIPESELVSKIRLLEERNMLNIRSIIRNLTPPEIENADFALLLSEFAGNVKESSGIECKFYSESSDLLKNLTSEQKLHIFRIIQESVNNSIKHAHPTEISIIVRRDENNLVFVISDDGRGIKPGSTESPAKDDVHTNTHLGIKGMKSRAVILGAELFIRSNEESGTQIKLCLPD